MYYNCNHFYINDFLYYSVVLKNQLLWCCRAVSFLKYLGVGQSDSAKTTNCFGKQLTMDLCQNKTTYGIYCLHERFHADKFNVLRFSIKTGNNRKMHLTGWFSLLICWKSECISIRQC